MDLRGWGGHGLTSRDIAGTLASFAPNVWWMGTNLSDTQQQPGPCFAQSAETFTAGPSSTVTTATCGSGALGM